MNRLEERRTTAWGAYAAAFIMAAALVLLIGAVHRVSPRTLVSFHGLIHAAIADRFVSGVPSSVPPENPFFAGEPLCYYWFFQFLAAQLVRHLGMNVFHAFELIIMLGAVSLVFCAVVLGCRLFRSTLAGCMIAYLVVAGTNPLGFLCGIAKVALHGLECLQDDPNYLWGVVHPLFGLIRFNDIGGLYGPLLNFHLNITSRPVALAGLLAMVVALDVSLSTRRLISRLLLVCATSLTTALSPVIGLSGTAALVLGLAAPRLTRIVLRRKAGVDHAERPIGRLGAMVSMVLGALLAVPTYYHLIIGPSASQTRFWLATAEGMKHLMTVTLSILPLLILAYIGWRRSSPEQRPLLTTLLVAGALLLVACSTIVLPAWNQSNCFHAAVVFLAVPGGAIILRPNGGAKTSGASVGRALAVGALFLPTTILVVLSYVDRPPVPVTFEGTRIARTAEDTTLAMLYRWVQKETPLNAVFVVDPRLSSMRVCGNTSEFPAMTGRALFTQELAHYIVSPYPEARRRVDLAVALVSGVRISASDREYLKTLGRPIYVLTFDGSVRAVMDRLRAVHGEPIFKEGNVAAFGEAVDAEERS